MDTGKSFIIENRGKPAVSVDCTGQQRPVFDANVTGRMSYADRVLYKRNTLGADDELKKKTQMNYTPATMHFTGYAQAPNQAIMPYSNENEYQVLLKRHLDKGRLLSAVTMKTQGRFYGKKIA